MKHSFILFIFLYFPVICFAQNQFIIFNSIDDYINIRVKPTEKIIKEVYKGDFLFGIPYSVNDINAVSVVTRVRSPISFIFNNGLVCSLISFPEKDVAK